MSAFGMHPTFHDEAGYMNWLLQWRGLRKRLKMTLARLEKDPSITPEELQEERVMMEKLKSLKETAVNRWERIQAMHTQIEAQMALFPMTIEALPILDFHFNKVSLEFPFMPAWTIKGKGKTFYVNHVDFEAVGTTRETPDHPATKGAIRFRHVDVMLRPDGTATITRKGQTQFQEAA